VGTQPGQPRNPENGLASEDDVQTAGPGPRAQRVLAEQQDQIGKSLVFSYHAMGSRRSASHRRFAFAWRSACNDSSRLARCHSRCRLWPSDSAICSQDNPAARANEMASFCADWK
jgi:hypothetical protein